MIFSALNQAKTRNLYYHFTIVKNINNRIPLKGYLISSQQFDIVNPIILQKAKAYDI